MWKKYEAWVFRFASLGWIVLLSWESGKPGSAVHIPHPVDKVVHASAFGVLGFFLALGSGGRLRKHNLWLIPLVVAVLGVLDEWHQSFSPGRTVSAGDALADAIGGLTAAIAWWLAKRQGEPDHSNPHFM